MHVQTLIDQRHDKLTPEEIDAVLRHIDRVRTEDSQGGWSDPPLNPRHFNRTPEQIERYNGNMMRSILLASSYPDNIRQIVEADERVRSYADGMR
jgi:hypothetical protein